MSITSLPGTQITDESIESKDLKNGTIKKEDLNLTDCMMVGATSGTSGSSGIVTGPVAGDQEKVWAADASWVVRAKTDDTRFPTQDENDALAGTNGTPSATNKFVTNDDGRNTNARTPSAHAGTHVTGSTDVIASAVYNGNAGLYTGADKKANDDHRGNTSNPHSTTYTQVGAEPANANIQSHISNATTAHGLTIANVVLTNDNRLIPYWITGTSYSIGNFIALSGKLYRCLTANSDATFTATKWVELGLLGTTANTMCAGNDARLNYKRTITQAYINATSLVMYLDLSVNGTASVVDFPFLGSTLYGTPTSISCLVACPTSGGTHSIRLQNITNNLTIGTITITDSAVQTLYTQSTLSNIPTGPATLEWQTVLSGTTSQRHTYLYATNFVF